MAELESDAASPTAPNPPLRVKSDQLASLVAASVQRGLEHRQIAEEQAAAYGVTDLDAAVNSYESGQHALNQATRLLQQGDNAGAEGTLRQLLAHAPHHPAGQEMLGAVLEGQGRLAEAAAAYRGAIEAGRTTAETYSLLGFVQARQADFAAAAESYSQALALVKHPVTYRNLGAALEQQGQLEEAVTALREALALDPTSTSLALHLAGLLLRTGQFAEARGCVERVLTRQPDDAEVYNRLGRIQAAGDDFQSAILSYRRALALNDDHQEARNGLAACRNQAAPGAQGRGQAGDAGALGPALSTASSAGSALSGQSVPGRRPQGRKLSGLTRPPAPAQPPLAACLQEAEALCAQQQLREAEACYRRALAAYPQSATLHAGLGMVYCLQQRFAAARQSCLAAAQLEPRYVAGRCHLGIALAGLRQYAEAEASFRAALELDPAHIIARFNLSYLLYEQKRDKEAAAELQTILAAQPAHAGAQRMLEAIRSRTA